MKTVEQMNDRELEDHIAELQKALAVKKAKDVRGYERESLADLFEQLAEEADFSIDTLVLKDKFTDPDFIEDHLEKWPNGRPLKDVLATVFHGMVGTTPRPAPRPGMSWVPAHTRRARNGKIIEVAGGWRPNVRAQKAVKQTRGKK